MSNAGVRYSFGPLEKRGLILGMRIPQVGLLIAGALVALVLLHLSTSIITFFLACIVVVGTLYVCFWPMSDGRTLEQTAPVALRWALRRWRGEMTWTTFAPLTGHTRRSEIRADMPPTLKDISIIAAPVMGGEFGVIKDAAEGTYAAVISVRGRSFALLDDDAKSQLLSQWADVLSSAGRSGSPLRRLQWLERAVPDPGDAIGQYMRESVTMPHTSTAVRSYLQLIEDAGPTMQNHETFVVVQIDRIRAARPIRQAGGGDDGACAVLARETYSLASRLQAADLDVVGLLTPRLLAQSIRISIDPAARTAISLRNVNHPDQTGVGTTQAWPISTNTTWSHYQTDSAFHATFWVAEWPRSSVGPDFLAPLLLQTWGQRTISVVIEPVPTIKAQREVEAARTIDIAESEMRQRHGFLSTMRRQRDHEAVLRREEELADGHADIRFSGYITVTAADPDSLDAACSEIEQQAAQSRLVLRRLGGQQDVAFTYTLPLARGLA